MSITISWTAGFNGGSEQTLFVVYHAEDSSDKQELLVDTNGITSGDVIHFKLRVSDAKSVLICIYSQMCHLLRVILSLGNIFNK